MVFKEMKKFIARDLSTAQSGVPFLGFEMNEQLEQELNDEIYPEGLLDYTEEDIPDIMTCAGLLVNFISLNIDVSWHTTLCHKSDFNPCRMVNAILLLDLSYVILISSY